MALLAMAIAACAPEPAGDVFRTTLLHDGAEPVPVVFRDQTGLVTSIEPARNPNGSEFQPVAVTDPTDASAVVLTWVGGLCDESVTLSLTSTEAGRYLVVLTVRSRGGGCPAIGVPRGVRILTTTPIPISSIDALR